MISRFIQIILQRVFRCRIFIGILFFFYSTRENQAVKRNSKKNKGNIILFFQIYIILNSDDC